MHQGRVMLPVWFFVGVLLLAYGIILLVTGVQSFSHPPSVVLARYHASFWGGILLTVVGGAYTLKFWPRSSGRK